MNKLIMNKLITNKRSGRKVRSSGWLRCRVLFLGAVLLGSSLQSAEIAGGKALRETISMDRAWNFKKGALLCRVGRLFRAGNTEWNPRGSRLLLRRQR